MANGNGSNSAKPPLADDRDVGEPRWPMAVAVLAAMSLVFVLPDDLRIGPRWLLPTIEGIVLIALIIGDPGRINRRSSALRALSIGLVAVLAVGAIWSTIRLADDLIHGGPETNSANALLSAGANVWLSTVLAFALVYFELDAGGPAQRAYHMPRIPHLAFPQQINPDLSAPGWRPRFGDYLYLGFTNATAFSPTDVMPLARWAKAVMAAQALISLVILGLVVARAVNILA